MRKSENSIPEINQAKEHLIGNISLNNDENFMNALFSHLNFFNYSNQYENNSLNFSTQDSYIEDDNHLNEVNLTFPSPFSSMHNLNSNQINDETTKKNNTSLTNNILITESDNENELDWIKASPSYGALSSTDFEESRKRGRKKKNAIKPNSNYHSKNRKDNRKNKIKVHFLNFIIDFTNGIIKGEMFGAHNILFRKLPHSEKKDTRIERNHELLNKTIEDILTQYGVSSKYKNKGELNKISLDRLKKKITKNEYKPLFDNYLNTTVKTAYKELFFSNKIQELLQKYKIKRGEGKRKIIFLNEFIQNLREKHNENDDYIDKFTEECHSFISEFEEKKNLKRK